jgi:hypothetical protein
MLDVSRDAVAVGEEQLISCASEQSKYSSICTVILDPCGDLPLTSWGRWQCFRGGADGLNGCYAACGCGSEYRCGTLLGETCGDMLEAMACITPSQPNEAMARIASRRNRTISLDPNLSAFNFRVGFLLPCRGGLGEKRGKIPPVTSHHQSPKTTILCSVYRVDRNLALYQARGGTQEAISSWSSLPK